MRSLYALIAVAWALIIVPAGVPGRVHAAGTTIHNTATFTYVNASGQPQPAIVSNAVTIAVMDAAQTAAVAVKPPTVSGEGGPGDVVFYAITVTNQDVLTDDFSLTAESASTPPWSIHIYADDGAGSGIANDGVHQSGETNVTPTADSVAPGGSFKCFAAVWIPSDASDGSVGAAVFTATSQSDAFATAVEIITTAVSIPRLKGQVTDKDILRPLVAAVEVYDDSTLVASTVTEGPHCIYRFGEELPPGTYKVSAAGNGYVRQTRWYTTVTPGECPYADFFLEPSGILRGQVRDAVSGLPVPGATIEVFKDAILRASAVIGPADATYEIARDLAAGANSVCISKHGYVRLVQAIDVVPGATTYVNALLQPSCLIAGYVRDAYTGQPVIGADVRAYKDGVWWSKGTSTAPWGAYRLDRNLPPGSYDVIALSPGYADKSYSGVRATPGITTNLDIFLTPRY
jgi:hypothetical protein